jgi:hypothetical protein
VLHWVVAVLHWVVAVLHWVVASLSRCLLCQFRDDAEKLSAEEWERVVAVFCINAAWQFNDWPIVKKESAKPGGAGTAITKIMDNVPPVYIVARLYCTSAPVFTDSMMYLACCTLCSSDRSAMDCAAATVAYTVGCR